MTWWPGAAAGVFAWQPAQQTVQEAGAPAAVDAQSLSQCVREKNICLRSCYDIVRPREKLDCMTTCRDTYETCRANAT